MAPTRGRRGSAAALAAVAAAMCLGLLRRGRTRGANRAAFLVPALHLARPRTGHLAWGVGLTADVHATPLALAGRGAQRAGSAAETSSRGWQRFNDRESWAFLLGASPFSYSEVLANTKREKYMDNLVWVSQSEMSDVPTQGCDDNSSYPPAFTSYLSRLLLARDARCAAWWSGALSDSGEASELIFARFERSVAATVNCKWAGAPGSLAAALIKRFGGRFPFDAVPQVRVLFSLLDGADKPVDSFFEQGFSTDRDELMEVFLVMDADGNGMLNATEIQDTIGRLGGGWLSSAEVEQMLGDALANSDGEVDFNGFKYAVTNSHKASRARAARGWSSDDWWRDPAALLPANRLDDATPELLLDAHRRFEEAQQSALGALQHPAKATPLVRELMDWNVYVLLMLAGAFACTITHVALVPIDVVKTLQQSDPDRFTGLGLISAASVLWQEGGLPLLFLGLVPTCVGYLWYGATVFPGYELFKRKLLALCGPRRADALRVPLVLLSGAIATFFACIGVCPAEAVRIRTVTEHGFQLGFLRSVPSLYAGFAPLLFRQVLFGMAKFLVFDVVSDAVLRFIPWFRKNRGTMLVCSLISGGAAGLMATFVSQPSDAILTRVAASSGLGIAGAASSLFAEGGLSAFFVGFGTRAIWASFIIAGQFLFYDIAKQVFKVTTSELTETADAVTTALKTREPPLEFGAQSVPQLEFGPRAEAGGASGSAARLAHSSRCAPAQASALAAPWPARAWRGLLRRQRRTLQGMRAFARGTWCASTARGSDL